MSLILFRVIFLLVIVQLSACSNMLFYPMKQHLIDPVDHGVNYQDIYIESEKGEKIHGWVLPQTGELKATILFFHGNGENISTHISSVFWLPNHGYRVILIDYRGYGKSQGKATLAGAIKDIQLSIRYSLDRYAEQKPVIVMGQSLGASMSVYAVTSEHFQDNLAALILISPFSDYQKIAQETLSSFWLTWLFQVPLSWTINTEFNPKDHIASVNPVPVYIVHGSGDKLIDPRHSIELFDIAKQPKQLYIIEGGHNDLSRTPKYRDTLLHILDQITPASPS